MNKEEVKGGTEKVGGKIKEKVGKTTGKADLEQEGRKEQAKGQAKENLGKIKEALKDF